MFKTKKMKVQNDLKHVHMVCTSHSTSPGVIGSRGESWRGKIDESVQKLLEPLVDRIVQRLSAAVPSHGFQFPILILGRPRVARLYF